MIRAAAPGDLPSPADDDRIAYDVKEVGRLVGLDPETIARYVRRGEIRASKIGRSVRILRVDVIAWLESKRIGKSINANGPGHHPQAAAACKVGRESHPYPQAVSKPTDAAGARQGESGGRAAKGGGA